MSKWEEMEFKKLAVDGSSGLAANIISNNNDHYVHSVWTNNMSGISNPKCWQLWKSVKTHRMLDVQLFPAMCVIWKPAL